MMAREREMQLKLDDERRRLETEYSLKERDIQERARDMMRANNETIR
jgi:hypothetical protein